MAKIGLQLYTVRDHLEKDYIGTIKAAAEMGYDGVEFPGGVMDRIGAGDLRILLKDIGLELAGIVFDQNDFERNMGRVVDYCRDSGCTAAVYPYIPDGLRRTETEYIKIAEQINGFGAKLTQHGVRLLYHIHGYEFVDFGAKKGFDILLDHFEPGNVGLEIDVYWVEYGGENAVSFTKKYIERSPFIHFKDYTGDFTDTEVGAGAIDMAEIARIGVAGNAEWFIVEQEQFDKDSAESAKISCDNLKRIIKCLKR